MFGSTLVAVQVASGLLGMSIKVSWLKFSPGHLVASCHERIHGMLNLNSDILGKIIISNVAFMSL